MRMRWWLLAILAAAIALFLTASIYNATQSAGPVQDPESLRVRAVVFFDLANLAYLATAAFFVWSQPSPLLKWFALVLYVPIGFLLLISVMVSGENINGYRSWEIQKFTQYAISVLMILVGLVLFLRLGRAVDKTQQTRAT
jgi:hypothetical protein